MWFSIAEKIASGSTERIYLENMTPSQLALVRDSIKKVSQMMSTEQLLQAEAIAKLCINEKYKKCE